MMRIGLKGVPIVVSAPSGAGKTTICKLIAEKYDNVLYSVSATTRPPRDSETDGIDYFFLSRKKFERWIREGRFVEWAKVHGHYYGTPRELFEENLRKGYNVIMDIDVQGGSDIKKMYPEGIYIFLLTKNVNVLRERLSGRKTDSPSSIKKRLENARVELGYSNRYNYIVINDKLMKEGIKFAYETPQDEVSSE
ncbi:MAG: guanylate kinase [Candidatus Cloacimonas sp. 4484_209]|nr:MAG: guanylate kinase [Candidatus Cloacimonas sp. 4484_209]